MIRPIATSLTLLVLLAGCDTNANQDDFFLQSELAPSGFTRTNAEGVVDEDNVDPDDWRTAPAFGGSVIVAPAAPNPVGRNDLVTITVQDTFGDVLTGGVTASGFDDSGRFVRLDTDTGNGPFYTLTFSPSRLQTLGGAEGRLYRVRVFTIGSRIVSYGDILVQ